MEKLFRNLAIIFSIFIWIFLTFSIITYNPNDPSLLRGTQEKIKPDNIFGYVGASLSGILFQIFGFASFLFIILLIYIVFIYFNREIEKKGIILTLNFLGFFILLLGFSTLFSFIKRYVYYKNEEILSGGIIGASLEKLLVNNFNNFGTLIILILSLIIAFILFFTYPLPKVKEEILKIKDKFSKVKEEKREEKIAEKIIRNTKTEKEKREEKVVKERPKQLEIKNKGEDFYLPDLSLLDEPPLPDQDNNKIFMLIAKQIEKKFEEFQVKGKIEAYHPGPVVTTYEFSPAGGIKLSRILALQDDLALALKVDSVRTDRLPNKGSVGIEVPNPKRQKIFLKSVLASKEFQNSREPLTLSVGQDIFGYPHISSLASMPHLLVAGTTGSGKSVFLNTLILSLLYKYTPSKLKLILIDLKKVEFSVYEDLPHLLVPIISTPKEAMSALMWSVQEMDRRSNLLKQKGIKDIENYNFEISRINGKDTLPYIVIFIDELAELMFSTRKEAENPIVRLAQMARAVGIHLVLATQRPSVDVITGLIKGNFPARIALRVADRINSRIIIDDNGAEKLLGQGDMLFLYSQSSRLKRLHGAYVSPQEVERVVKFLKSQGSPNYIEKILTTPISTQGAPESDVDEENDPLYQEALKIVLIERIPSATYLQRRLKIGFAKAGRFLDIMEKKGIVGPSKGAKPREILIPPEKVKDYLKE